MELREDQEQTLNDVGEEILATLTAVAQAVQLALSEARAGISANALANPSNTMVAVGRQGTRIQRGGLVTSWCFASCLAWHLDALRRTDQP